MARSYKEDTTVNKLSLILTYLSPKRVLTAEGDGLVHRSLGQTGVREHTLGEA
jgi:hypothetical protein